MAADIDSLKASLRRWTLILGVLQITVGCVVGFIPPSVGALIGASSKLMPTINEKFPPPHGTDNPIVSGSLLLCGVTIMVALLLTLYGLLRSETSGKDANA